MILNFDPHQRIQHIVIVGLGGTGSQVARSICRMVYDMKQRSLDAPKTITFVDPDVVEPKNVGRQMFTATDAGAYKAAILGRRFNMALGLDIQWYTEPFDPDKHVPASMYQRNTLLIGAVDNHEARQALAAAADVTWIDCGNHHASGQVVIGNTGDVGVVQSQLRYLDDKQTISKLPNAALLYPELLDPEQTEPDTDLSCADLVQHGDQHLLINEYVALAAAQYTYKLLHRQPIQSFATFVDADSISMRSVPITGEELEARMGVGDYVY